MRYRVRVRGSGSAQVAAHGLGHAEQVVEKELHRLWPEGRVRVAEVARTGTAARIVEEFEVRYWVEGMLEVVAPAVAEAPAAAFRRLRGYLVGTRFRRTEWEAVEVSSGEGDE